MDYMVQDDALIEKVDDIGKQLLNGIKGPDGRFIPGGDHSPLTNWCKQHNVQYQPVDF